DNDSRPSANIGSGYADGAWHHVLADIIPSGTTTVYVDGSSVGTMSTANESDGTTALGSTGGAQPLGIGRYVGDVNDASQGFDGLLDDIRIGTGLVAFVTELASQRGYQPTTVVGPYKFGTTDRVGVYKFGTSTEVGVYKGTV